jgi:hypothetical protein
MDNLMVCIVNITLCTLTCNYHLIDVNKMIQR